MAFFDNLTPGMIGVGVGIVANLFFGLYVYALHRKNNRKRTVGVMINKDSTIAKVVNINLGRDTFEYDGGSYNIIDPYLKIGNVRYIEYVVGNSDPISPVDMANSRLPAETYNAILKSKVVKDINTYTGSSGLPFDITPKQALIGMGIVVAIIIFLTQGGLS